MKCKANKLITLLLSIMLVLSAVGTNVFALEYGSEWSGYGNANSNKYSDVPESHWAYEAISRASSKNWFGGYPDGSFRPDGSITRAEALKVFVVFLGLELNPVTESSFYDVNPKEWYAPYIEAGKDLFPTHTTIQGKTPFNPDMPVTREDTIYALVNALGYQVGEKYVDESVLNMFTDKNSISGNLRKHFAIALANGLVAGFPDGTIRAQDSLTRAEFATLLYRGSFASFSDNYEAKITKVTVSPVSPIELTIGESVNLTARAEYSDGTNKEYTGLQPYVAENSGVVSVTGTTITALKEGTAVIKYYDSDLKDEALTVTVKKPSDAPVLKITRYDDVTKDAAMVVEGTATDKNGSVDLTCNGKDVLVNADGSFKATVSLTAGTNNIQFVAKNIYGIETTKSISVVREEAEEEEKKEETKEEPVIASVKVTPANDVEMTIGDTITLSARATYTDKTSKNYSEFAPYIASGNGVVTLKGTTVTAVKEGTAVIKYNDEYLVDEALTITVNKPTDAPKIKITEYPETTELSSVVVSGFVEDKNLADVDLTANGKYVKFDSEGNFSASVALKVGTNEIKFAAVNQYGTTAEKTISITRTDVPVLKITDYKQKTTMKTTPVSGTIEYHDLRKINLVCNGEKVTIAVDGTFTTTAELKAGKNPFHFVATTEDGNTAEQAIIIRRYDVVEEEEKEEPPAPPAKRPEEIVYVWDWMDTLPSTTQYKKVEVVLVIDDSGSLGGDWAYNSSTGYFEGGNDPKHVRLEVARNFVDSSNENAKIGIVKFDSESTIVTSSLIACNNDGKETLKDMLTINNGIFDSRGQTYMYSGINDGFELFESNDPDVMKVMIVFSDGVAHDAEMHAQTILNASEKNITIYTVGLGASNSSYFDNYMKPLATNTGGMFYLADNADNLKDIFETITIMIDTVTDSDSDGIADYYEDTIEDKNGNPIKIDKNNADTDGDGLSDGEEVRLELEYNADQTKVKVTAYMSSNPTMTDSDGDGVGDKDDHYALDPNN